MDSYQQTLDYLYTRLPMFSRIGAAALKPDLSNTIALCADLGNPQERFKSIHIAGTNGKGSTSHMLAVIFQEGGYKTGLYTSPHLVDFRERIRIDGKMVSKDFVVDFVEKMKDAIERIEPSFFEITVAMAFAAFAEVGVDIAVIETGLGGRLDSTNVITPELSVITNISLDHTDLLGKTIPEIAREKAGIIKRDVPVVIGEQNEAALPVFEEVAQRMDAPIHEAFLLWSVQPDIGGKGFVAKNSPNTAAINLNTDISGSYQQHNIGTVLTAVDVLQSQGWKLEPDTVQAALENVKGLTGLRGRWDIWQRSPLIVADVAHNPAGLMQVMQQWKDVQARQKHIILGFVRDKDVRDALSLFPKGNQLHFCAADIPRALPAEELQLIARDLGFEGSAYPSVAAAISAVRNVLSEKDALLITGSFFVVGEAMTVAGQTVV